MKKIMLIYVCDLGCVAFCLPLLSVSVPFHWGGVGGGGILGYCFLKKHCV